MASLILRFKKNRDGSAALSCARPDGSTTWQHQQGARASFFPRHDLTHYAVETVLGHRRGFYGLVADGWDFPDFGTPWPRGPMPADADPSELIVGFLDAERASGVEWAAAEFSDAAARFHASQRGRQAPGNQSPLITEPQLAQIRARMRELFNQWETLAPGDTLELTFNVAERSTA